MVIASLARYRAPEALEPGDPLPAVTLRRADDLEPVALVDLSSRPSAAARLRQLHLTAVSSPVGRRREPLPAVPRPGRLRVRLYRRGARRRRVADAGEPRGRRGPDAADDARATPATGARDRRAPRARHAAPARRDGQRSEHGVRRLAGAARRRRRRRADRLPGQPGPWASLRKRRRSSWRRSSATEVSPGRQALRLQLPHADAWTNSHVGACFSLCSRR